MNSRLRGFGADKQITCVTNTKIDGKGQWRELKHAPDGVLEKSSFQLGNNRLNSFLTHRGEANRIVKANEKGSRNESPENRWLGWSNRERLPFL